MADNPAALTNRYAEIEILSITRRVSTKWVGLWKNPSKDFDKDVLNFERMVDKKVRGCRKLCRPLGLLKFEETQSAEN